MNKEILSILEVKIEHDIRSFEREVADIIEDVEKDDTKLARYQRLRGAIQYGNDLLDFFDDAIEELSK